MPFRRLTATLTTAALLTLAAPAAHATGAPTDVAVTVAVTAGPPSLPVARTVTITVVNRGPHAATGVVAAIAAPTGAYVHGRPRVSTGTLGTTTWKLGKLAAGGRATYTATVLPSGTGTATAGAAVVHDATDPAPRNNVAKTTFPIG